MTPGSRSLRAARYERAARRYERLHSRVERRIGAIATLRFVAFAIAAVFGFAAIQDQEPLLYGVPALAGAALFGLAVWLHRRPFLLAPRAAGLARVAREGAARLRGEWDALPDDGSDLADASRPALGELQVFGRGSLYQLLSRVGLPGGRRRLAALLTDGAEPADLGDRQAAARELARLGGLRHRLEVEARLVEVDEAALTTFLEWAERTDEDPLLPKLALLARVLVPTTWVLVVLSAGFDLDTPWRLLVLTQLLLFLGTTGRLSKGYLHLLGRRGHRPFVALRRMFALVESRRFDAPLLLRLRDELTSSGERPSARLKVLEEGIEALSVRESALTHAALNVALLWEIRHANVLERWRRRHGARVRADLEAVADLEALGSIAAFAADHPDYAWPEVHEDDAGPMFDADTLGHPLFADGVRRTNDFLVAEGGSLALVTGSNMSGKSSFLRTVGCAVHLAQAGAPICASRLRLRACELATSIQVTDAPGEGLSRFYAEVKRIRAVLERVEAAEADPALRPCLYLVDEMLSGTNSRERHIACRSIVARLVDAKRSYGLVTTHDLELVGVVSELPAAIRLCHFSDRFDGEALHFDYTLREGVAQTTNALHVLRMEGIEVEG